MLSRLRVKNYALIDEIDIEFSPGLNIITGETGAGKSILIGALGLCLGERATAEAVRSGSKNCFVEAIFQINPEANISGLLNELGVEPQDGELILRREVDANGRSRNFINDASVTARRLKEVGDLLVDLHGQHEHQALLRVETHVDILDSFGGLSDLARTVKQDYNGFVECREKLEHLLKSSREIEEKRELYEFQLNEIREAKVSPEETSELESKREILENMESLTESIGNLYDLLYNSDNSISDELGVGRKCLEHAVKIDKKLENKLEIYDSLIYQVGDIASFLKDYMDSMETDPNELELIRERLALISRLKKKYGGTVETIIERKNFLERELGTIDNLGGEIDNARRDLEKAKARLAESSLRLSKGRWSTAKTLSESSKSVMHELGMEGAELEVRFTPRESSDGELVIEDRSYEACPGGIEKVEFYILTNPGEDKKPLVKIASGGEISRVMLSLKSVLSEADTVATLIFDEIDIGISGRIAEAVGRQLKVLSGSHQTISITHLPQIAKMAESHFSVLKTKEKGRSITKAFMLNDEGRKKELARLLGGEEITDITFRHAEELLKKGKD